MFEKGSGSPAGLDVRAALAAAVERRRTADRAEADLLALAAHWADLHAVLPGDEPARHQLDGGRERIVPLAGPGAPEVAEFAPADLGAALGLTTYSAERLIGDALELRHRLPRLWLRVHDTVRPVQAWRARRIADHTKGLSVEAAAWVDAKVAPVAHKIGIDRTLRLVEAAILRFDPETAAERALPRARTDAASGSTRRWSTATWDFGSRRTRWMPARSTPPSRWCPRRSPSAATRTPAQARRAKAIGYLADPEAARQLLSGETPVGTGRKANGTRPRLNLYVHLHEDAITSNQGGVARVEQIGPVLEEQIRSWVARGGADSTAGAPVDVKVTAVRDLADTTAVDAYETPDAQRETVLLRTPCCPFPWCNNLTRNKDMEHIEVYVPPDEGGPPGQTAADKLAGVCRRHHRLKTHGGWRYTMPEPGIYLWVSPLGLRYLVDNTGTTPLAESA